MPVAYKKPIRGTMLRIGLSFVALMIALIIFQSARMLHLSIQRRYDAELRNAIAHAENVIDLEDLQECVQTGVPSEKYYALRDELDLMVDDFRLIYIYVCIPADDGQGTMYYPVCSLSEAERAAGRTEEWPLMYEDRIDFTAEQIQPYLEAWEKSPETSTFEGESAFGPRYTMVKPLVTEDGETFALLGADISTLDMRGRIRTYVWYSVGLILFISLLFAVSTATWLRKSVTEPLRTLEKRAREFAERIQTTRNDPEQLIFDAPQFKANNEIQWLSDAIAQMSGSMRDYVKGTLAAQKRAETAEEEVEGIARVAYVDPLTQAQSKVAYEARRTELLHSIGEGKARFAVVVVDLNNLKRVNDTYGLEKGNQYLISACRLIQGVYKDVPVYRVGGDEFAVILENEAYLEREELFAVLEEKFGESQVDMGRELWERCSAAAGMAEFSEDADTDVSQVYRRAEKIMSRNKRMMKEELG